MRHVSYAVYDSDTGEILHVHVDAAGVESSPDEIIQMVDGGQRHLAVFQLPSDGLPMDPVRVIEGDLRPAEEAAGQGAAGGSSTFSEIAGERRYARRPAPQDPAANT